MLLERHGRFLLQSVSGFRLWETPWQDESTELKPDFDFSGGVDVVKSLLVNHRRQGRQRGCMAWLNLLTWNCRGRGSTKIGPPASFPSVSLGKKSFHILWNGGEEMQSDVFCFRMKTSCTTTSTLPKFLTRFFRSCDLPAAPRFHHVLGFLDAHGLMSQAASAKDRISSISLFMFTSCVMGGLDRLLRGLAEGLLESFSAMALFLLLFLFLGALCAGFFDSMGSPPLSPSEQAVTVPLPFEAREVLGSFLALLEEDAREVLGSFLSSGEDARGSFLSLAEDAREVLGSFLVEEDSRGVLGSFLSLGDDAREVLGLPEALAFGEVLGLEEDAREAMGLVDDAAREDLILWLLGFDFRDAGGVTSEAADAAGAFLRIRAFGSVRLPLLHCNLLFCFYCRPIQQEPLRPPPADAARRAGASIQILSSEIMREIQNEEDNYEGALFVLPSQLNGAEYTSYEKQNIVQRVEEYLRDNTGGPRGQLAAHPAAAQFVIDNAANEQQLDGINAVDQLLKVEGIKEVLELRNGYLEIKDPKSEELEQQVLALMDANLHTLRPLVMEDIPASGLTPNKGRRASEMTHKVGLVYASAVPVQAYMNKGPKAATKRFQEQVAERVLTAQYFGALKHAAEWATEKKLSRRVFLMPLGGGVFNNPWESICSSMAKAMAMLSEQFPNAGDLLEVHALAWNGSRSEKETLERFLKPPAA
eukprot:s914_g5.t1